MTTTRAPVPPVDLKARIAALQGQQAAQTGAGRSSSQVLPKANAVAGNNALKDRIASFEKQGAVPKPKGRFGFAPSMQQDPQTSKRSGELYGNRIPGLSRPHIPVPASTKSDKKQPRSRSASRLELDRYATSPSPPGSPFITSDNGDFVGDVFSDGDPNSANDLTSLEDSQQQSLDALLASTNSEPLPEGQEETVLDAPVDDNAVATADEPDPDADQQGGSPAVAVSTSEPPNDALAVAPIADAPSTESPLPPDHAPVEPVPVEPAPVPEPTPVLVPESEPTPVDELAAVSPSFPADGLDPAVLAVIEQLDRATQTGDAGVVVVPAVAVEAIAELPEPQKSSVQDMLDQLLREQDMLDVATPIKQRFSLNGSLSQMARNYLVQELAAKEAAAKEMATPETPEKKSAPSQDAPTVTPQSSGQFLTPSPYSSSSYSPDAEPLSPASDIYSSYYAATPASAYGRALPVIPEAPDSPIAIKNPRRGTFGTDSIGSTAPSSPPIVTPSDDGKISISPSDSAFRITTGPERVKSPPLSVVIPRAGTPKAAPPVNTKETRPPSPVEAVIVSEPQRIISPTVTRGVLVPAPHSASSSSSPSSTYSVSVYSDGTTVSPSGPVGRKPSMRKAKKASSPPLSAPYEEPLLTPLEGPRGFRAVVHEKVVEGKSRPVSMIMQYDDLPSPTPMNAANVSDLAALLADAAMLERQLANGRGTPQKKLPGRPGTASQSAPTPPPGARRGTPERPRPTQDLPESPDDAELFNRLSQDNGNAPRTSQYETSRQSYEQRPLPARPSIDRERPRPSIDHSPSRPSDYLERIPSIDRASSARPSMDSVSSARPQLQPMFLTADPNAARIPLPARPKSAGASRNQTSIPPSAPSPPKTGYLTNLLSRAKSTTNLRLDPRDSVGSSSEDSVMVSTPPTPPYEPTATETGSVRSSRIFKNSFSRASNFADKLLHRKEGSQSAEVAIASGDEDDQFGGSRALPRPPRPLPLPPRPLPPRGLPPPVPAEPAPSNNTLAPVPPPGQPGLQRRGSWKSIASVSTTGISEALDNIGVYDFPSVPEAAPEPRAPVPRAPSGLPPGPTPMSLPDPPPTAHRSST
ncbi:hypothetical protein C8Q74DRAFT_93272 [Fomes fomentarius]|nr:hypothetical protein C8Q74DRAFT_93272 [Fomes fomentarius]